MAMDGSADAPGPTPSRFQFKLDRRTFSTVHLSAITRIYGEHGSAILELLRKNPGGTIPVVLRRLKQKDAEWRKAREELNRQWKDTLEQTFHKSLDRRSYFFKADDKRHLAPKALLQEIKDAAQAMLPPVATALASHSEDDPKSVQAAPGAGDSPEAPTVPSTAAAEEGDSAAASAPTQRRSFTLDSEPHMTLSLSKCGVRRDAYRLVMLATDHMSMTPQEKEDAVDLWQDLMHSRWLGMPVYQRYGEPGWAGGSALQTTADEREKMWQSLSKGSRVLTSFGEGSIAGVHPVPGSESGRYVFSVDLTYGGWATLQQEAVLAPLAEPVEDKEPEIEESKEEMPKENGKVELLPPTDTVILASTELYVLMRFYHILLDRLEKAHKICPKAALRHSLMKVHPLKAANCAVDEIPEEERYAAQLGMLSVPKGGLRQYSGFLAMLGAAVRGPGAGHEKPSGNDHVKFEEAVQGLIGNEAYMLFTLDKLVMSIARQLKSIVDDPVSMSLVELWKSERAKAEGAGGWNAAQYQTRASRICANGTTEDIFGLKIRPKDTALSLGELDLLLHYLGPLDEDGLPHKEVQQSVSDGNESTEKDVGERTTPETSPDDEGAGSVAETKMAVDGVVDPSLQEVKAGDAADIDMGEAQAADAEGDGATGDGIKEVATGAKPCDDLKNDSATGACKTSEPEQQGQRDPSPPKRVKRGSGSCPTSNGSATSATAGAPSSPGGGKRRRFD
jgi:hypothetical protein